MQNGPLLSLNLEPPPPLMVSGNRLKGSHFKGTEEQMQNFETNKDIIREQGT